jgi:hypothetical protein
MHAASFKQQLAEAAAVAKVTGRSTSAHTLDILVCAVLVWQQALLMWAAGEAEQTASITHRTDSTPERPSANAKASSSDGNASGLAAALMLGAASTDRVLRPHTAAAASAVARYHGSVSTIHAHTGLLAR